MKLLPIYWSIRARTHDWEVGTGMEKRMRREGKRTEEDGRKNSRWSRTTWPWETESIKASYS